MVFLEDSLGNKIDFDLLKENESGYRLDRGDFYEFIFRNGITLKCYDKIFSADIKIDLPLNKITYDFEKGYLKEYSLSEGDMVIDGGAFVGAFTLYASKKVGLSGIVLAFEPCSENFKKLKKNVKLNKLQNVILINKGLWNKDMILPFFKNIDPAEHSFLPSQGGTPSYSLPVVSIDEELERRGINKVDFIKMDVEGAELSAIEGAKKTLLKNKVHLAIASYHILNGKKTCFALEKLFTSLGYNSKTDFPIHLTTYAWRV